MQLKVCIVGAGPAGFALAADLESRGISVLIYSHPTHPRHARHVLSRGHLKSHGAIKGITKLRITFDMREVVEFSRIMIFTVPSTGQMTILGELKNFDLFQHTIIAVPGNLFSLIASAEMKIGHILETNISPYSCRMHEGELTVFGKKGSISIASLQPNVSASFKSKIQRIFPQRLRWCYNVVEVSLSNINGVFHPLMILMNAGRIESNGSFLLYRDGLTRSVSNAILAVDKVRLEIGTAFGFHLDSVLDTSNRCYGATFTDLVDLAQNSEPHKKLLAPQDIENRNVSEDVPDLLVCWHGLAEKLGIESGPVEAVVGLARMATGVDYMRTGRNLRNLNLEGLSRGELLERFSIGRVRQSRAV
ncbi:NAD/NADP octopine/nopaline dehydrogenase [Cadophora sp. MPI-SDFR-AT-0126]|nr:NAD/NADP octopine/nopaline dehydrogenase [Leotiomycetes sp. MPI-SDFR-AT-0126]